MGTARIRSLYHFLPSLSVAWYQGYRSGSIALPARKLNRFPGVPIIRGVATPKGLTGGLNYDVFHRLHIRRFVVSQKGNV